MKVIMLAVLMSVGLLTGCQSMNNNAPTSTLSQQVAQTLIINYNSNVDKNQLNRVINRYRGVVTHQYDTLGGLSVRFPTGTNISQAMQDFKQVMGVTNVERDQIQTIQAQ